MTLFIHTLRSNRLVSIYIVFILFAVVHLLLLFTSKQSLEETYILAIFYAASGLFYQKKLSKIQLSSQLFSKIIGTLIVGFIYLKTLSIYQSELKLITLIVPPIFWLGLIIIVNGIQKIFRFWRFLLGITVFCWIIPYLASYWFRSPPFFLTHSSALWSAYGLWYLGLSAKVEGNYVFVNNNVVEVNIACTALPVLIIFLSLLLVVALYFPRLIKNIPLTTAIALGIGFVLSIIRIMIMAVVVNDKPVFSYWHGGTGANIFMSTGLLLFGGYLLWQMPANSGISISKKAIAALPATNAPLSPLMSVILWALIGLLGTSLLVRQGGVKLFAEFAFPETIPIPGWNLIKAESLSPLPEMQLASQVVNYDNAEEVLTPEAILAIRQGQKGTDIFMSGRRYYYGHPGRNERLTATFRYIVNVDPGSSVTTYYQRQDPNSEIVKTLAKANQISRIEEKNILFFIHQDSLYYSACLTPDRQTQTASYNQITGEYNTPQLLASKFDNLIPWLMGQKLLQDDRCLWMELKLSPLSAASASELKPSWQDFLNYWTKHYPRP